MLKYIGETNAYFAKGELYKEILLEKSDWASTLYSDIAKSLDCDLHEAHRARVVEAADGSHVLMTVQQALEKFNLVTDKPIARLRANLEEEGNVYRQQRVILQELLENHVAYTNITLWHGYENARDGGFDTKVDTIVEEDNESFRIEFYDRQSKKQMYWIYMNDFLTHFDFVPTKKDGPLALSLDYRLNQDYVDIDEVE
ncbi:hypothetical protein BCPG3_165 [Bacillus phage BCPG3]|uniref:Uncharacterized protein n=2 Tax=Wphvirus TaxID=1922327 RepID=W5QUD4_9CAUD|nr:hypothetical protein BPS10C_183 [Bacillus phage BPS10C]YP_009282121.1 hypothetical protein SALINJAH_167 [Bacillus phage SalinJah]QQO38823.1 hypothetical protein BCPG1_092 [Bacillus phage BCPG1]QSJ04482.1 hypothetical protein BCPG3_165 [Bacillus phage BCPG3]QSJ04692.1 hypothetical protein BCP18_160 [Bacillus phage BCP18]AGI12180.1 hypothetical protein BPS10C_183 [Bacillus phage BPS10C]ANH50587.1 hypothetical protein SALINJAH_167 [Bacillus phage SalinJah]